MKSDPEQLEEVVSYLIRPRHMVLGAFIIVVVFVVFALSVAHVIEAKHERARQVLECSVLLRTGESLPQVLWDANDMQAASYAWCDDFVDREGRSPALAEFLDPPLPEDPP